jgi:hypothetical protein
MAIVISPPPIILYSFIMTIMVKEPPLHSSNEWEHIHPWCTTLQDLERNYLVLCIFVFKINISKTCDESF